MKAPLDGQLDEAGWLAACKAMAVNEKGTAIGYGSYRSPARAAITAYLAALPAPPGDTPHAFAPSDEDFDTRCVVCGCKAHRSIHQAAPPGDLVGALREAREALVRTKGWLWASDDTSITMDEVTAAITRADAALASAERPESEES